MKGKHDIHSCCCSQIWASHGVHVDSMPRILASLLVLAWMLQSALASYADIEPCRLVGFDFSFSSSKLRPKAKMAPLWDPWRIRASGFCQHTVVGWECGRQPLSLRYVYACLCKFFLVLRIFSSPVLQRPLFPWSFPSLQLPPGPYSNICISAFLCIVLVLSLSLLDSDESDIDSGAGSEA